MTDLKLSWPKTNNKVLVCLLSWYKPGGFHRFNCKESFLVVMSLQVLQRQLMIQNSLTFYLSCLYCVFVNQPTSNVCGVDADLFLRKLGPIWSNRLSTEADLP